MCSELLATHQPQTFLKELPRAQVQTSAFENYIFECEALYTFGKPRETSS
jgi:hypothetical protein